jgi:hypothetical protein
MIMKGEKVRIWKEVFVACSMFHFVFLLKVMRITSINRSKGTR